MDDNIKKSLNLLFLVAGLGIFCLTILMKVECWAQQAKADLKLYSSELDWQDFLYQRAAQEAKTNINKVN